MSPKDLVLVARLRKVGCIYPVRTLMAARATGLNLALAAAMLMQESGGGYMEFGHDPTIFTGAGMVTKEKYAEYAKLRDETGKCQGVGATQLTSAGLQKRADAMGGCWRPLVNMKVGFQYMADSIRRAGLRLGVKSYNGSGPAADAYAARVIARANEYAAILGTPRP